MNKKLACYFLIFLFLLPLSTYAQEIEKDILFWLERHSKQELKNLLDAVRRKYPNSAVPLFLEAYTEENGDRSLDLYKQIIQNYPDSKFTDDAQLRVAQYYFAIGSYVTARQYVDNLVDQFPKSSLVAEAKYLAARCLIASGYYISAEDELEKIIRDYPNSIFKNYAKRDRDSLDELSKENEADNSPKTTNNASQFHGAQNPSGQQFKTKKSKGTYTIQIGAFRDRNNAQSQKEIYSQKGYLVTLDSKFVNGNLLHLVWVSEFDTEEQAARFGEVFKNLHGVSFHVVKK